MFKKYIHLPAGVYVLFFATVINSMGNFVHPFLTLFLTDKLGLSTDYTGVMIMLITLLYLPGSLIGGKLADTWGRKNTFIIFSILSAASFIYCGLLFKAALFVPLMMISSFSLAVAMPAASAMMMDLTNPDNRTAAFSLHYMGINIGFAVGPMIAGFLYLNYARVILLGDGVTTLISLLLVALLLRETKPSREESAGLSEKEQCVEGGALAVLRKRPLLLVFAFAGIFYSLVYSQAGFSLPLFMNTLFATEGPKLYGVAMSLNGLTVIFLTAPLASLTARWNSSLNVALAGILYAGGFGMLFLTGNLPLLLLSTFIWTLGEILYVVNTHVYIANSTPASHRGRFNSIIYTISWSGRGFGPWLTGIFLAGHAIRWLWPLCFVVASAGAIIIFILYLLEQKKQGWYGDGSICNNNNMAL